MLSIRPLTSDDRQAYLGAFDQLSPQSRRSRFFSPKPSLSETEIDYFVDVDHHCHEALVAMVDGRPAGVARFIRDQGDPTLADVAITVVDRWQHQGIGRALTRAIARRATEEGVGRLRAHVLGDNRPALGLVAMAKTRPRRRFADGVVEVEIPISA
jgi:GNAT superfamily N-acetyltransferase